MSPSNTWEKELQSGWIGKASRFQGRILGAGQPSGVMQIAGARRLRRETLLPPVVSGLGLSVSILSPFIAALNFAGDFRYRPPSLHSL